MSSEELPVSTRAPIDDRRYREGRTVTWVSVAVNLALTVTQIGVGMLAHAQSLVADGFHSLSDLVADFMVLVANFHSRHPADAGHPYGHHRVETVASFGLGLLLVATGGGILWAAAGRIQHLQDLPPVGFVALWVAAATLAAKEGLFRYMLRIGEKLRSPMLIANAWHARSDAASSLVVTVGIAGSLMGFRFLDPVAAVIVGFMILRMGTTFSWDALRELMDEGVSDEEVAAIRDTVRATSGVFGLHELRTRRMAQKTLIDAHIQVDGHVSVSEGHRIGEEVRKRVLAAHEDVIDMLVHVDPEDDFSATAAAQLPEREALLLHLRKLLGEESAPEFEKVQLHYLGQRVEAEIFLPTAVAFDQARIAGLEQRLMERLRHDPYFRTVSLNCTIAPR
ncbi:MAG TPA: cation diffusion facilitator family transporter [Rhodocyclaceae bacterium]|nr:cation diffusion facilitator family transporter [Rhodocyclaceae bacterium]